MMSDVPMVSSPQFVAFMRKTMGQWPSGLRNIKLIKIAQQGGGRDTSEAGTSVANPDSALAAKS